MRISAKAKKAARNISSAAATVFHLSLKKANMAARLKSSAAADKTPAPAAAMATEVLPNGMISRLAISQTASPIAKIPSGLARIHPLSASGLNATKASGNAISAAASSASSQTAIHIGLARPSYSKISLHVPPAR